jgi:hypothetical protein
MLVTSGAHSAQKLEADMKAERRKSRQAQARERLWSASMRAEDDAVAYLYNFDPAVAFATACRLERTLAIKWEAEQEEMRRRRDPRKVMEIGSTRVRELDVALARLPQGVCPDPAAERHLLQILKDLPPDRAWWVSHLVVRYQGSPIAEAAAATRVSAAPGRDVEKVIPVPDATGFAAARA